MIDVFCKKGAFSYILQINEYYLLGSDMDKKSAYKIFSDWYEGCVENGIEPEEIVAMMGGMALITNEELVERLQGDGEIPSY